MSILPFGNFAQKHRTLVSDWTNQEMADFFRAHRLLVQSGATIGIDKGRTDIGEPWLVFYDTASQDVFLHIARIESSCVLVCEHLNISLKADRIDHLISLFEKEIRSSLSLRIERASNVVVHPAAKIIMSISAVFLLFKFDNNSSAFAREVPSGLAQEANARKEVGLPARVHSALARLLEGAETPVAMAALASVILANDLLTSESHDANADLAAVAEVLDAMPLEQHVSENTVANQELVDVNVKTVAVTEVKQTVSLVEVVLGDAVTHNEVERVDGSTISSVHALFQVASLFDGAPVFVRDHGTSSAPVVEVADTGSKVDTISVTTLSAQVLGGVAPFNMAEVSTADLAKGIVISEDGSLSLAPAIDFDLSLDDETIYGFSADTALSGEQLMTVLRHLISGIGRFELESQGDALLVAQLDVMSDDTALLGIWSNIMSDGSSISIVGQIDLINDVPSLLDGSLTIV